MIAQKIAEQKEECDKGSIIMIAATDLPVSERQLHRILKRASVGLARLGSFVGHGSGEIMIGFSTATRVRYDEQEGCTREVIPERCIRDRQCAAGQHDDAGSVCD